jgi:ATP-dependent Zn protease
VAAKSRRHPTPTAAILSALAAVAEPPIHNALVAPESQTALSLEWRRLTRVATVIAVLTTPSVFYWYHDHYGWRVGWAIVGAAFTVIAFRGLIDVVVRKLIPWPSLFGNDDVKVRENDVVNRRRAWTWRWFFRFALKIAIFLLIVDIGRRFVGSLFGMHSRITYGNSVTGTFHWIHHSWQQLAAQGPALILFQVVQGLFLVVIMLVVFIGPLLGMGYSQIRSFEPGDADWGVKLDDIRGQQDAKEEVRHVVTLWQSGEIFEKSGGKRERGLLFLGPPGTGKTMLAKGIATNFNCPFVSLPGSGFASTFIGIDAVLVRLLVRKAKKLARKWGGQCIIFIDEIDAIGMRRASLGNSFGPIAEPASREFYGPLGAVNPGGDIVVETREWRDWLFARRAPVRRSPYPGWYTKLADWVNPVVDPVIMPGGMGGGGVGLGQLGFQQLLVQMDGVDNPPFFRRYFTNKINSFLDAIYIIPRRVGKVSLRVPRVKVGGAEVYFIGATNVPIEALDPALTRPGRMGRHVSFRTPTKDDRKDIFDLYLGNVSHEPVLDTEAKRDEIARITNGYSPAMIDQVCSMALTRAHHDGRMIFNWDDLMESMVVLDFGSSSGFKYTKDEAKATAIHEAGHAVTAHMYNQLIESSRLSIKPRGNYGGVHMSFEKEDRFGHFQSEEFARVLHSLGAMAAEIVFYDENTTGVTGDLGQSTHRAVRMVTERGMAPKPIDLRGKTFADETPEQSEERVRQRFEDIGLRLMSANGLADGQHVGDPRKRAYVAQILGQAFATAYNAVMVNREKVDNVANALVDKQEIFGDDLLRLLDGQRFVKPEIDWTDEASWPKFAWSKTPDEREREPNAAGPRMQ